MSDNRTNRGMSALSVLALIFFVLKVTGLIDWSWWWVLSPIWIPFMVYILAILIIVIAIEIKMKKH